MRRLFLLLGVCLVIPLVLASAVSAQQTSGQAAIAGGAPLPPAYVLYSDGNITIEGDVGTGCYTFVTMGYSQTVPADQRDEAQAVADECQRLGLPTGDRKPGDAEIILSIGSIGPLAPNNSGEVLPDTGGFPLDVLVGTLAGSLALTGIGSLLLKRSLNYR